MGRVLRSAMLLSVVAISACGQKQGQERSSQEPGSQTAAPAPAGKSFPGNGDITEVSSDSVTISHGPIPAAGWPAMTMTFRADDPKMIAGLNVGDPVDFQFRQSRGANVLTSIQRAQQ